MQSGAGLKGETLFLEQEKGLACLFLIVDFKLVLFLDRCELPPVFGAMFNGHIWEIVD
jgi:hypothetical protein